MRNASRDKLYDPYTDSEIKFIKKNYKTLSDATIASCLRRTVYGVAGKRLDLNLIKRKGRTLKDFDKVEIIEKEDMIHALIYFIERTKSTVWRDIANTERKRLIQEINDLKSKLK